MMAIIGGLGGQEVVVILMIILLLFGAKKLPELARSLGQGVKEFRKSIKEISDDVVENGSEDSSKSS